MTFWKQLTLPSKEASTASIYAEQGSPRLEIPKQSNARCLCQCFALLHLGVESSWLLISNFSTTFLENSREEKIPCVRCLLKENIGF